MFRVAAPQVLVFCTLPFGSLPAPVLVLPSTNHPMYSFRRTAYSASPKIEAQVPPKQQLLNPHIVTQKIAILTTKIALQKVVVSKVIFNLARRIKG
jgi:hypothetical protein